MGQQKGRRHALTRGVKARVSCGSESLAQVQKRSLRIYQIVHGQDRLAQIEENDKRAPKIPGLLRQVRLVPAPTRSIRRYRNAPAMSCRY